MIVITHKYLQIITRDITLQKCYVLCIMVESINNSICTKEWCICTKKWCDVAMRIISLFFLLFLNLDSEFIAQNKQV